MGSVDNVDLVTCDQEPIHIPGAIQPHGALLALDLDLVVRRVSDNAPHLLGRALDALMDHPLDEGLLSAELRAQLERLAEDPNAPPINPLPVGDLVAILHRSGEEIVIELETPAEDDQPHLFAIASQRALATLQTCRTMSALLDTAVAEVKAVTGFDRVMAYRFAPDASGEVVAEVRESHLEPYLGLHYPASDIPAQARRLYTLNPIRLIADAKYEPVPLHSSRTKSAPLDMSFSILRSVSPIHCEYLTNMGVSASMSISILVQGELWGLIACHHYEPHVVPYANRITAQLLSTTLSLMVDQFQREVALRSERSADQVIRALVEQCRIADDVPRGLTDGDANILDLVEADGAVVTLDSRVVGIGRKPPTAWTTALLEWLHVQPECDVFDSDELVKVYAPARDYSDTGCGLLAAPYHRARRGYVLLFRGEHRTTVEWAGDPNKSVTVGPNGARLTPRGSFELWRETVAGRSLPWTEHQRSSVKALGSRLTELLLEWTTAQELVRNIFVGMVGHDMRTPLSAITTAGELLHTDGMGKAVASRIASSSQRMRALVDSLLDLNQVQSGQGIGIDPKPENLHDLIERIVAESSLANPGTTIVSECSGDPMVVCDARRIEQVVANLTSNARHHGDSGRPITVRVTGHDDEVVIAVHNWGNPIPDDVRLNLFKPYQGPAARSARRSGGLGLGLHIARAIVVAHGGRIAVRSSEAAGTTFTVNLLREPPG